MNNMHKKFRMVKIACFILIAIAFMALLAYVVMLLWNNVLVEVLRVSAITFWQALGILVLSKILFGGLKGGYGGYKQHWKNKMQEKWQSMSPEEREKVKEEWGNRCRLWKRNSETDANAG